MLFVVLAIVFLLVGLVLFLYKTINCKKMSCREVFICSICLFAFFCCGFMYINSYNNSYQIIQKRVETTTVVQSKAESKRYFFVLHNKAGDCIVEVDKLQYDNYSVLDRIDWSDCVEK